VLLAGLPPEEFECYLREVEPVALTRKTVVDKDELRAIIEEVREQSYATTVDQLDYGITAIAVPIRGSSGRPIGALNSSGYTGLLTAEDWSTNRSRSCASLPRASPRRSPVIPSCNP
jgi:IclR family transcriptional regulator, pca regulon regulatory protein